MQWASGIILIAGLWATGFHDSHAQTSVEFSGQTIQSAPDGRSREAQLNVGDNQVRLEYKRDKQELVEIYDMKNHRVLLLMPQQKQYRQRVLPAGPAANPMVPSRDSNPCSAMPEGECKKLGSESLYGRSVSKWEVTLKREDETLHSLHWIDDERKMSLRDVWPDGSVSELVLQGRENFDGRATERWQRTTTHPDGKKEVAKQWYDPELQIAIREELPGGFVREIKHIRIAKQPAELFRVPAGYSLVEGGAKP